LPFLSFASVCFFGRWKDPERGLKWIIFISPDLSFAFWKRMEKVLKKVKKKRKCKDGTERERERENKIRSSSIPVRDFSNFGRRRFGIEDVEQIADRRSQIGTRASIDEETFRVTKNSSPTTQCLHKRKAFPHHRFPPMRGTFEVTVKK
tara:strand:- start:2367 stop:2813 length:447 start_codon:yes stop_codon:yes gene_type:complete